MISSNAHVCNYILHFTTCDNFILGINYTIRRHLISTNNVRFRQENQWVSVGACGLAPSGNGQLFSYLVVAHHIFGSGTICYTFLSPGQRTKWYWFEFGVILTQYRGVCLECETISEERSVKNIFFLNCYLCIYLVNTSCHVLANLSKQIVWTISKARLNPWQECMCVCGLPLSI